MSKGLKSAGFIFITFYQIIPSFKDQDKDVYENIMGNKAEIMPVANMFSFFHKVSTRLWLFCYTPMKNSQLTMHKLKF